VINSLVLNWRDERFCLRTILAKVSTVWNGSIMIVSFLDISNDTDLVEVEDNCSSLIFLCGCVLQMYSCVGMRCGDIGCSCSLHF